MTFSLYILNKRFKSSECFFKVHTGEASFSSPFYPNQEAAELAIKNLVLKFRRDYVFTAGHLLETTEGFGLVLFGKKAVLAAPQSAYPVKSEARTALTNIRLGAQESSFELCILELLTPFENLGHLSELDLFSISDKLEWQEVETRTLYIKKKKKGTVKPSIGLATSLNRGPCDPLFSLFQPYLSIDHPLFHGRKQEVEDLYALSQEHDLLLLYGLPRVGKSSLIQCGLVNKMEAKPGEVVVNRRQEDGMLAALNQNLRQQIKDLSGDTPSSDCELLDLCTQLQDLTEQNMLLVFDELESIFQPEVSAEEREEFFDFIRCLLEDDRSQGRIILSLREAYLAPLADYEESMPGLLDNRFHLHPMSKDSMADVSFNLLDAFQGMKKMTVDEPETVSKQITAELADEDGNVPFHCMQIYLSEIHQNSCARSGGETPNVNSALIQQMGPAENVIQSFIDKQIVQLESMKDEEGNLSPEVQRQIDELAASRQQCGCQDPTKAPAGLAVAAVASEKKSRSLRSMLWLALLGLLLSLFAIWWLFCWLKEQNPCYLAQQDDSCEAYVNYLCTYGEEASCAEEFYAILEERQCQVGQDYLELERSNSCITYQSFYEKYNDSEVCTDKVRQILIELECPMIRDTVQLTLRDTVIERVPTAPARPERYGGGVEPLGPGNSDSPPCILDDEAGTLKKVGPLWMMADPLPGGPYNWLDALEACQEVGMRLPCIGEVDFLLENFYGNNPERAYSMLSGNGVCYLINPSEVPNGRINFWTGTEANDALSWSFYFDTRQQNIGREANIPKTARLPCLCVKKDPNAGATGLPPCYNKSIDRVPAN